MNLKLFIDRPIFAAVISALILMVGIIGLTQLPIEQFPDIAPPTINVTASYTGANAETVEKSVIAPLEEAINGVENMIYMTSSSTNTGQAQITVYFKQGSDADMAQVNVQNRVTSVTGLLPAEVTRIGVTTKKRQMSTLKVLGLRDAAGNYDKKFVDNYMKINVVPRLSRIQGVGDVMLMGSDYSMRIWLNPQAMAQYGLIPSDITSVLAEQNIESPTGTLGEDSDNTFQYTLKYRGRYTTADEFEQLVIHSLPSGEVLRLGDVATIELGALTYGFDSKINGTTGTVCLISQQAGSNANEIIIEIDAMLEEMGKELPKGLEFESLVSTKDFLDASIANVIGTLLLAIVLVILVVYLFLQSLRATLIPAISIIVSLVGTFAFLLVAGFSLNLLTLFALVLVIGTVVDNSIVVVEAVQAKFDEGIRSPYEATVKAMGGISTALITTSLVFMAVFIPVCFMEGATGTFYTQFGITMAVAVIISTVNAMTLCPALCALFMTPPQVVGEGEKASFSTRFNKAFNSTFDVMQEKYKKGLVQFEKRRWIPYTLMALSFVGLYFLMATTKTGLIPQEDTGTVMINIATPPGSTLAQTTQTVIEVSNCIKDIEQVQSYAMVSGYGMLGGQGASNGMMFLKLKPWAERTGAENHIDEVIKETYARTASIKSGRIMVFAQPLITGYGNSSGVEMYVQDKRGGTVEELQQQTQALIQSLGQAPEIMMAYTTFDTKYPQYKVEVDAERCKKQGVSPATVLSTLSGYVGGNYASNLNLFSKLYRVMVQASPEYRLDPESLNNIFVRTATGEMSPIGQYVKLTKVYGSESLTRLNMFPAISVNVTPAQGYSSGQALEAVRRVSAETLANGYGYDFVGQSREEASVGNTVIVIFAIIILLVYFILCALYESLFIPLAILFSVPFGLFGSFLFAKIFGIENNVYMQTGLIMLMGLLAKTAILITECASQYHKQGMSIKRSAIEASKVRLRPILMTALTMVFGLIPMIFASGVGANGNKALAIGTVGGMLIGTLALLYVVPCLFIICQRLQEKWMPERKKELSEDNNKQSE